MSLQEYKIKQSDIVARGVQAAPDVLSGDPQENKKIFDRLIAEVVTQAYNGLIDRLIDNGAEMILQRGDDSVAYIRLNDDNVLEFSTDGIVYEATGSSGHLIIDGDGNFLPQRSRLKFANTVVEDTGDATVVRGVKGDKGDKGEKGDTGSTGSVGPVGPVGPSIVPSIDPDTGVMSFTIVDTAVAPQSVSVRGPQGPQGVQGATGMQGARGPQGIQGPAGLQGIQGPAGETGPAGATGPAGPAGPAGPTGAQGPAGADGKDGTSLYIEDVYSTLAALRNAIPNGNKLMYVVEENGECYIWSENEADWISVGKLQGATGPQGPVGAQGPQGPAGPAGATGPEGPQGVQGVQGPQGPIGPEGPQGPAGTAGADGKSTYQAATDGGYTGTETALNNALAAVPTHVNNTTIHITADERTAWNGKATMTEVNAAISAAFAGIANAEGGSF